MKKLFALFLVVVYVLCLFGCNKIEPSLTDNLGREEIYTSKETWEDTNLSLKISNVKDIKSGTNSDGFISWDVRTYYVYPNSKITIENADMMVNADDGKKYPQWAFMKSPDNNGRIDIVDDMQPIQITKDILYVYNIEGKVAGIYFEIVEP